MSKNIDKARRAAATALVRVHRGGWTSEAVDKALAAPSLSPRDRAFAGALFFGSAERLVTLDALLAPLLSRPMEKLDVEVRALLETGLYQILYMRVPARAAVDEAVELVRVFGRGSAAGLVNAVLRKAAALYCPAAVDAGGGEDPNAVAPRLLAERVFDSEEERVRMQWSVSGAVARAVMESLPGEYDAFFAASFSGGILPLRANTRKTTPEELAGALQGHGAKVAAGPLPACLLADMPGGVLGEPLFENGLYHVQGVASQYAVACLAPKPGERVLDLCAAPGGKSATIAEELGGGEGLTLRDVSEARLEKAKALFARLGIGNARFGVGDAARYDPALAGQDAVLCDVPCTGLGVMGKKPDLRYAGGENFSTLPPLQLKILSVAARYLGPGGRLVYATCTIRREENEEVVRAFLSAHPEFALYTPPAAPEGARVEGEMMTLLPHRSGTDGFFIACLVKK